MMTSYRYPRKKNTFHRPYLTFCMAMNKTRRIRNTTARDSSVICVRKDIGLNEAKLAQKLYLQTRMSLKNIEWDSRYPALYYTFY